MTVNMIVVAVAVTVAGRGKGKGSHRQYEASRVLNCAD